MFNKALRLRCIYLPPDIETASAEHRCKNVLEQEAKLPLGYRTVGYYLTAVTSTCSVVTIISPLFVTQYFEYVTANFISSDFA